MAFVRCRECGHEIKADTKQTRCEKCGTFFPFTCAVCDKFLRPPFAVYEDERYVTDDHRPLCQDHYQKQCPECKKWFQADENPGYFLCLDCTQARQQRRTAASDAPAARSGKAKRTSAPGKRPPMKPAEVAVFAAICGAAVIGFIFMLMRGG